MSFVQADWTIRTRNKHLKELKVDAKAEQKNKTGIKIANTFSSNPIYKAQKSFRSEKSHSFHAYVLDRGV